MSTTTKIVLIMIGALLLAALLGVGWGVSKYNTMVSGDESVKAAWAQVDNQLQRRADLIPNLVETVKGYAGHEKEVLLGVTEARAKAAGAATVPDKIEANNQLTAALGRLLLVVERYPDLKASANFIRLQDELAGTENRIAVERRRYNETVKSYNVYIRQFPNNIIAGMRGFEKAPFYEVPEPAKARPEVKFD
jgi:LemA protein